MEHFLLSGKILRSEFGQFIANALIHGQDISIKTSKDGNDLVHRVDVVCDCEDCIKEYGKRPQEFYYRNLVPDLDKFYEREKEKTGQQ